MNSVKSRSFLLISTLVFPLLVLLTAYGAIAVHTGNAWPWLEIVHESGNRTLLGTVFYFEHAARELLLDVVLGIAIAGSALWVFPGNGSASYLRLGFLAAATALIIAVIVVGALWIGGAALLSDNLLQMHTRPGETLSFGSHWRYHLLSRSLLILVSLGLAGLIVLGLRGAQGKGFRTGQLTYLAGLVLFLALTVIFGLGYDSFVDPLFLGHQARETLTHCLVTLPLAWWVCLVLGDGVKMAGKGSVSMVWPLFAGIGGVLTTLYLLVGAIGSSAISMGQTESLTLLIFPHFFEHTFSYLVVSLVAAVVYESVTLYDRSGPASLGS